LWVARYKSLGKVIGNTAFSLAVSPDGKRVYVTGKSEASRRFYLDYATVAYDAASGAGLWVARYNGPGNGLDAARSLAVSPDGTRVYVAGTSFGSSLDYATLAYDAASGKRLWLARYDGNGWDAARSLAVSPDGARVYVTGRSAAATARTAPPSFRSPRH
jgi:DNA-binding beta-propeller fold protein YncE